MVSKDYGWSKEKVAGSSGIYWLHNPGTWSEAIAYLNKTGAKPDFNDLFTYMSNVVADNGGMDYVIHSYSKLSKMVTKLPGNKFFVQKLMPILIGAISNFMVRNYVGTIALSGMISEMMIDLLFDVWNEEVREIPLSKTSQEKLFGRKFKDLSLDRCIEILYHYNIITVDEKSDFRDIKKIRNDYVHLYSKDLTNIEKDAENIFNKSNRILEKIIGMEISEDKIFMNFHIANYLKKYD